MGLLAQPVALHDVADAEAFVHATIIRSRILLTADERDELVCEGLAIMQKLAGDYQPHIQGHLTEGRFSGYAAMYLPRKLGDAWHRMHQEHQLHTQPDGKRRWQYGSRSMSLDALNADDPNRFKARQQELPLRPRVRKALDERWARKREMILDVADILGQGGSETDAATQLGLTRDQVQEAVVEIMLVADRIPSE